MLEKQSSKHKICYVVTLPLTIRAFFIPQLKYLAENGFEVTVVCAHDSKLQDELGEKITYIPVEIPRGISLGGMIRATLDLLKLFKLNQYDIVQYSTPNAAFCAAVASKIARIKVRNYHLMGFRYLGAAGISKIILKVFEKITCMLSTTIECVSKSNYRLGAAEGLFSEEKATVVWNGSSGGVDLKRFDYSKRDRWRTEIRAELGYSEKDYVFGFVGRVTRDKGINEILEAFFQMPKKDSKLLIIGNQEGTDTLDSQLLNRARGCKDILFHESVSDIERYYAALDVLLLPSYREGFGNVIIEAAAVGTPAIISDIPGPIDAIKEGKTGIVVPVSDSRVLAEKMYDCVNRKVDFQTDYCAKYVAQKFNSLVLCENILIRKTELIREEKTCIL